MVLAVEFKVAPFKVNVPELVVELFPIVNGTVREEVISIAPIEGEDVFIFIPTELVGLEADGLSLLNWAMLQAFQSLDVKFGDQFVAVNQASLGPVFVQIMVVATVPLTDTFLVVAPVLVQLMFPLAGLDACDATLT
jgi:hypothetical protein